MRGLSIFTQFGGGGGGEGEVLACPLSLTCPLGDHQTSCPRTMWSPWIGRSLSLSHYLLCGSDQVMESSGNASNRDRNVANICQFPNFIKIKAGWPRGGGNEMRDLVLEQQKDLPVRWLKVIGELSVKSMKVDKLSIWGRRDVVAFRKSLPWSKPSVFINEQQF